MVDNYHLMIKLAVSLINDINTEKFPRLLTRVINKLHLKEERSFTIEEEDKLEAVFGLDSSGLTLVLETSEFFLHQAAYYTAKPSVLQDQLAQLSLDDDKVQAFVEIWAANNKAVIEKLRKHTIAPKQLEDINWRLNIRMADSTQAKMHEPNAVLELGIRDDETKTKSKTTIEFSHDELYAFYDELENIQKKIDELR